MKFVWYVGIIVGWIILPAVVDAQDVIDLHGQVVNNNNDPLAGAHILVAQHNAHAVSDDKGHFKLNLPSDSAIQFTVSHIGYQTKYETIHLDSR
ncbi:MAG TPA: carboxypeptidase-like regulatory domain-containing protein, partial [Fodinibius sp.]|nr:carboxypeptidase-like regulatory domain-containing protein [Fodinibius sp.]